MIRGIDHVGLTVADLDCSLAFWHEGLGLPLLHRSRATDPELAALLGFESVEIEVADLDAGDGRIVELIEYLQPAGRSVRSRSCDPGSSHVAIGVDDLEAVFDRLDGSGAEMISRHPVRLHDPGGAWDGVVCCYLADPDGIIVELVQRPVRPGRA